MQNNLDNMCGSVVFTGNYWSLQWKMKFNPDPNKQPQEVYFSNRTNKDSFSSYNI